MKITKQDVCRRFRTFKGEIWVVEEVLGDDPVENLLIARVVHSSNPKRIGWADCFNLDGLYGSSYRDDDCPPYRKQIDDDFKEWINEFC